LSVRLLPTDRRAKLGTGSPEEVQRAIRVTPTTGAIEFSCEGRDIETIGLIVRHGKAQQRQFPGEKQPVRFSRWRHAMS
jgi:hypothetical protein